MIALMVQTTTGSAMLRLMIISMFGPVHPVEAPGLVPFRTMEFGSNASGHARDVGAKWIGLEPLGGSI